jgi:hypothetical protein
MHRSKLHLYSITRSAFWTGRPRALAVLRLMTNSNLVGWSRNSSEIDAADRHNSPHRVKPSELLTEQQDSKCRAEDRK